MGTNRPTNRAERREYFAAKNRRRRSARKAGSRLVNRNRIRGRLVAARAWTTDFVTKQEQAAAETAQRETRRNESK